MKVKIGNCFYDSSKEPIMLILDNLDKENISNMHPEATKFCSFPDSIEDSVINSWMDEEPLEE